MATPQIIIFAQGGTHGDFLHSCGLLMLDGKKSTIDTSGRVFGNSTSKSKNLESYYKGKKTIFSIESDSQIEIYHIWQEEFKKIKGKFYYISYDESQIDVIKKMFLTKVHYNDLNNAMEGIKKYLPNSLARKISKDNFDKILTLLYKNTIKKYKQQPGIKPIKITDLYNFDSLVLILKNMDILNVNKLEDLKRFHSEWQSKNRQCIKEMLIIENSVSKKNK